MKIKHLLSKTILTAALFLSLKGIAAVPVAGFTISPNPVCSGGTYTITDLSTNSPTAWSYTIQGGGPGPGGQPTITTAQNPTVGFNFPGTYSITLIATNSSGASTPVVKTLTVLAGPNGNINPGTPNICIGGTVNLIVNTGGGPNAGPVTYSWSTGATSSVVLVSPTVSTIYSCIISGTNGCSITRSSTVSIVNATAAINSVPASICPGTTSTLSATASGPGPWTYTWSNNTNTSSVTSSVTGVFSATVTNSQGCSAVQTYSLGTSSTLSLTASSTPTALCSGNTATLHITGASNYTWSSGAATPNTTVNPTSNTTYTVTGQIGTCTGTAAITLSVSVLPTITVNGSPTSFCAGASTTLNANGATTYTWLPSNVFTQSLVVTPSVSTTYTVRGINPGCQARTGTISIQVSPSPVINISANTTSACAGEAIALVASGANTYSWSNGTSGSIIIVTPTASTVYSVTGVNTSNCSGQSSISLSISDCTGINEVSAAQQAFVFYPNPAKGSVTFKAKSDLNVQVINITGQLVKTISLDQNNDRKLNVSDLASGIYFVKTSGGNTAQKLIIE